MSIAIQEIEVSFTARPNDSRLVGTLAIHDRRLFFEYHPDWLRQKLELSPFTLPLKSGLHEHKQLEFGPLFGLFDDSLPDGWGLMLMDRYFRAQGLAPQAISPLDRLLYLGSRTMGALTYHPPMDQKEQHDSLLNLHELAGQSQQIFAGDEVEVLPLLSRVGGSPGGARPKVLIGYNHASRTVISGEADLPPEFEPWIVKFSARQDSRDAGPVEYAYAMMAAAAGVDMPRTRLFTTKEGDTFFGVQRFDRGPGNRRHHIHTFGNLIQANFRIPVCDYSDLLKVTLLLTRNHTDLLRAFRLMIFNVLSHNRDDHVKNFSFILAKSGQWSLAPAYDLTFAPGPGGEHSTSVAGEGMAPGYDHFRKLAEDYDISPGDMAAIFEQVRDAVAQWPKFAKAAGVSKAKKAAISKYL